MDSILHHYMKFIIFIGRLNSNTRTTNMLNQKYAAPEYILKLQGRVQ